MAVHFYVMMESFDQGNYSMQMYGSAKVVDAYDVTILICISMIQNGYTVFLLSLML